MLLLAAVLRDRLPQELLGPVGHLRNPLLRERHWQAVADLLGQQVDRQPGAATSITQLLELQVCMCVCERVACQAWPVLQYKQAARVLLELSQGCCCARCWSTARRWLPPATRRCRCTRWSSCWRRLQTSE